MTIYLRENTLRGDSRIERWMMASCRSVARSMLVHTVAVGIALIGIWPPGLVCPISICGVAAAKGLQPATLDSLPPGGSPACCCSRSSSSTCCETECHCSQAPVPQPLPQEGKSSALSKADGISAVEWNTTLRPPVDKPTHGRAECLIRGLCAHPSLQTLHVRLQP